MSRRSLTVLVLALATVVLVGLGAFALGRDHASAARGYWRMGPGMMARASGGYGPWMMRGYRQAAGSGACSYPYGPGMMGGSGGYGPGMMGGAHGGSRQSSVTTAQLEAVRMRVESRLPDWGCAGFKVGEIMAFSGNDYVLVRDRSGKPAFELLADPRGRRLVPEPGPNMMWNTSYGMMAGQGRSGGTALTAAQAKKRADAWLAERYPGRVSADATALPGYFTIDVTARGKKVGMLSVNEWTSAVWYHSWHGRFLADQDF